MNLLDEAKKIVCSIIAVALAMTVAAVEALLPGRPDWLERVEALALRLRSTSRGDAPNKTVNKSARRTARQVSTAATDSGQQASSESPDIDADRLLLAYNQLWQFAHAVRSEGLALDEKFCERVEREWTVAKLLSFMRSADRSLQTRAQTSMETASTYLAAATSGNDNPAES